MKQLYLLLIILLPTCSIAQTLMQSDLPFAGLVWTSGVDSNYNAPISAGGAGQSWDYSNLQTDVVDTSGFQDAAGTPYAGTFPGANLAAHKISTDEWSYFSAASTGFYINGFVTGAFEIVFSPRQMYVPVPFSFGDMATDISRVVIDTTIDTLSAQTILNFHADFVADGNGSLITPTATYPSTLRVKETLLQTDSFLVDITGTGNYILFGSSQTQTTYYRWFQHGGTANYILGIDADSLGTTGTRSDYVLQWADLGTHDLISENGLQLYPVPASTELTISSSNLPDQINFYNAIGEKISLPVAYESTMIRADVSSLQDGIYFYSFNDGARNQSGKFSVLHGQH